MQTSMSLNAPEYVSEDTFEVTIDVTEITDLNNGQFDLEYDPDVLKTKRGHTPDQLDRCERHTAA